MAQRMQRMRACHKYIRGERGTGLQKRDGGGQEESEERLGGEQQQQGEAEKCEVTSFLSSRDCNQGSREGGFVGGSPLPQGSW